MLNVGGGEFLVILLVALIVLGPQKLPEAARQVAKVAGELKRISAGFQAELKAAMDDPIEAAARERGKTVTSSEQAPGPKPDGDPVVGSTAATAGMYDIGTQPSDQPEAEPVTEPDEPAAEDSSEDRVEPEAAPTPASGDEQ